MKVRIEAGKRRLRNRYSYTVAVAMASRRFCKRFSANNFSGVESFQKRTRDGTMSARLRPLARISRLLEVGIVDVAVSAVLAEVHSSDGRGHHRFCCSGQRSLLLLLLLLQRCLSRKYRRLSTQLFISHNRLLSRTGSRRR